MEINQAPRICTAILCVNEKHRAMKLYKQLSLPPLFKEVFERLNKIEKDKWKLMNNEHSEIYKEIVRAIRKMKREKTIKKIKIFYTKEFKVDQKLKLQRQSVVILFIKYLKKLVI